MGTSVGKGLNASGTAEEALRALLSSCPEAMAFALSPAAVRAPLPDDPVFHGVSALPGQDATAMDFVTPVDRMEVVRIWESAQSIGIGQGSVRLASDPGSVMTLTIVDDRPRHGVLVGLLTPNRIAEVPSREPHRTADPALMVPRRPRTATLQKNLNAMITDMDPRITAMLGWERSEMIGHRSLEFIHPGDHERAIAQWLEMRSRQQTERVRIRHSVRDGGWLWVEIENVFVGYDHPDQVVAVAHLTDISDEMAAHEAVRQREALFRRLADSLPVGVFQVSRDGSLSYVNNRLLGLLGLPQARGEAPSLDNLLAPLDEADRSAVSSALSAAATHGEDSEFEIDAFVPAPGTDDGSDPAPPVCACGDRTEPDDCSCPRSRRRKYLLTVASLSDHEGTPGAIVSVTDITISARAREELRARPPTIR
jgi:PAS domain S-box-containing protein